MNTARLVPNLAKQMREPLTKHDALTVLISRLRASEIRCANGFSQAYILITWMPTMISFMNLMRSSVLLAVRRRNVDIIFLQWY